MITRKIKQFITKNYNKEKDAYCWYNTEKKLSEDDISNLKDYEISLIIAIIILC